MPNGVKYNTSTESLALKKGNFYIATGDVGKGPTSTSGFYNGITPPAGGYTLYLNKASGGPSIYVASNDSDLITLTNKIADASYSTAAQCLSYFAGQTDKMVFNRDYEGVITSGLTVCLDAGFTPSYPKNDTTWYDLSNNSYNTSLTNGPSFSSEGGGSIVFDGVNDFTTGTTSSFNVGCISMWINSSVLINSATSGKTILTLKYGGSSNSEWYIALGSITIALSNEYITVLDTVNNTRTGLNDGGSLLANTWYNLCFNIESGKYKIYINGVKKNEVVSVGGVSQLTNPNKLNLGCLTVASQTTFFNGKIAITHIYDRGLTASEILQNFNAQKSRFGL